MKVGLNQRTRPAPLWFRRLRDGMINFLLPGLGQLIGALELADKEANFWLTILTFFPAGLNFVGVLLGEDAKKTIKVWVLLVGVALAATGCGSTKDFAAEQDRLRAQRMEQLQEVRKQLPCVPDTVRQGVVQYLPEDTLYQADTMIITRNTLRVDTMRVLDEAALAALRDSLAQAQYVLGLKDDHILALQRNYVETQDDYKQAMAIADKWRTRFWWLLSSGVVIFLLLEILGGKASFIIKPIKWLISLLR